MKRDRRSSIMGDAPRLAAYLLPAFGAALAASLVWPGSFAGELL